MDLKADLKALLSDGSVGIERIAERLDAASRRERAEAALSLSRAEQRALYRKAVAAPDLELTDFVPSDHAAREPVRHRGKNTLPLPRALQLFEKRFCRPEGDSARLFGYNESPFRPFIGPGFFVAIKTNGKPEWRERGSVVIDYSRVPDGPVARSWPKVVPNSEGLQRYVYHRTRDFMRRVSTHVTIGAAYKVDRALDHYFVLVRED